MRGARHRLPAFLAAVARAARRHLTATTELEPGDFRSGDRFPRVGPEHRAANAELARVVSEVAVARAATPSQVALAWLLSRRPWIVPIPGTKRSAYIEDNAGAPDVELTADDLTKLDRLAADAQGNRYGTGAALPNWVSPPLGNMGEFEEADHR